MDYLSSTNSVINPPSYRGDSVELLSPKGYSQPIIHPAEYTAFLSLMLSTIDTDELCENYFQYLAAKLPLAGISFAVGNETFCYGEPQRAKFVTELRTSIGAKVSDNNASTINYAFNRTIALKEQHLLHELHTHFCVPLTHTLSYRQLLAQATRDRLTSLGNRAAFDQQVVRMISQLQRHNSPFALLVIDLDNFKQVNDKFGHHEGDSVLMVVAEQLSASLRDEDMAFRFGGDEFCCLLHGVDGAQLNAVAERIRASIAENTYLIRHQVSASIGGTLATTSDDTTSLFKRADSGVYHIKQQQKNGVSIIP